MESSASIMKECANAKCKQPFWDHTDDNIDAFVSIAETYYSHIEDCQQFLNDYKKNPKSAFNLCQLCLFERKKIWMKREAKVKTKSTINWSVINTALIVLISFICGYYAVPNTYSSTIDITDLNSEYMVNGLKDKFPSLKIDLLKKFSGAFRRLKNPGEPIVFLLLHDDSNKITTDCLVSYTSILAKENIFTNSKKSLWLNASDWTPYSDPENEDLFYNTLIEPLKKNEVLVMENLQDLPWRLANNLHFLCDSENPRISKAMFILELRVNGIGQELSGSDKLKAAELSMNTAWIDAPISFRAALISRLTSYVDAVLLESDDGCSGPGYFLLETEKFIRISPKNIIVSSIK